MPSPATRRVTQILVRVSIITAATPTSSYIALLVVSIALVRFFGRGRVATLVQRRVCRIGFSLAGRGPRYTHLLWNPKYELQGDTFWR